MPRKRERRTNPSRTVGEWWELAPDAKFVSIPDHVRDALREAGCTPAERDFMTDLLRVWRRDQGLTQSVSMAELSRVTGLDRRNAKRTLKRLIDKNVLDYMEGRKNVKGGRSGMVATISLERLSGLAKRASSRRRTPASTGRTRPASSGPPNLRHRPAQDFHPDVQMEDQKVPDAPARAREEPTPHQGNGHGSAVSAPAVQGPAETASVDEEARRADILRRLETP